MVTFYDEAATPYLVTMNEDFTVAPNCAIVAVSAGEVTFTADKQPDGKEWAIVGPTPISIESNQTVEHSFLVAASPGAAPINLTIIAKILSSSPTHWGFDEMVLRCL